MTIRTFLAALAVAFTVQASPAFETVGGLKWVDL